MLSSEKTANTQLNAENKDKGIVMTQEELQAQLDTANATIEAQQTEISGLQAQVAALTSANAIAKKAVLVGMEHGASSDVIVAAMESDSEDKAENAIFKSVMTKGAITTGEGVRNEDAEAKAKEKAEDDAIMAYAEAHKA
jgi:multidrug efflux pump subunit AcrA (membrane-fusion protein)